MGQIDTYITFTLIEHVLTMLCTINLSFMQRGIKSVFFSRRAHIHVCEFYLKKKKRRNLVGTSIASLWFFNCCIDYILSRIYNFFQCYVTQSETEGEFYYPSTKTSSTKMYCSKLCDDNDGNGNYTCETTSSSSYSHRRVYFVSNKPIHNRVNSSQKKVICFPAVFTCMQIFATGPGLLVSRLFDIPIKPFAMQMTQSNMLHPFARIDSTTICDAKDSSAMPTTLRLVFYNARTVRYGNGWKKKNYVETKDTCSYLILIL